MGVKISDLAHASSLAGAELLEIEVPGIPSTSKRTTAQSVAKLALRFVSVTDFGAKGNGVTNDTAAIQAAIDAAQSYPGVGVYFPSGVYMVSPPAGASMLWLTAASNRRNYGCVKLPSNCSLWGNGSSSVIRLASTPASPGTTDGRGDYATTHMFVNSNAAGLPKEVVNENITVRGLKFDGNFVEQSGEGVTLVGVRNFSISGCEFTRSYYESNYLLYCRGGSITDCLMYQNGIFQIDGGGPLLDASSGINVSNCVITDCGYYSVLIIDCFGCSFSDNKCLPDTYAASAGYQAIRVARCHDTRIVGNYVLDSAFSAIWIHDGRNVTVEGNTIIHAGHVSGGGSQINGITIDGIVGQGRGQHSISRNVCLDSKGAGIAIMGTWAQGLEAIERNTGCLVDGNYCAWNQRDGIAVYGMFHRIVNNNATANGWEETSGIAGDGYNGIVLNGAAYCLVSGNVCTDQLTDAVIPLNLEQVINSTETAKRSVPSHAARYQNYGIAEYPQEAVELPNPTWIDRSGLTATVDVDTPHGLAVGDAVRIWGPPDAEWCGYFIVTAVNAVQWTMTLRAAPAANYADPADGTIRANLVIRANHNRIFGNNLGGNLANPTLAGAGGYKAYSKGVLVCGTDSVLSNNIGQ